MSMTSDLGFDGENKPIIPGHNQIEAKYRKYILEGSDDPCPGCGAQWKPEPGRTSTVQLHTPDCDMHRWLDAQEGNRDRG